MQGEYGKMLEKYHLVLGFIQVRIYSAQKTSAYSSPQRGKHACAVPCVLLCSRLPCFPHFMLVDIEICLLWIAGERIAEKLRREIHQ
jgi:hypothetical protein